MRITMEETAAKIAAANRVVITAHVSPDGDALGSSLALANALRHAGKTAEVLIDDDLPRNLSFLPGYDSIARPDGTDRKPDYLVVLDTDLTRIGAVQACAPTAEVLNIDHHISNDERATYLYLARRSAVAEMIFEILEHLQSDFPLDVAMPIFTGLATDTGFFRYSNTTALTMRAASRMIEAGVQPNLVSEPLEAKPLDVVQGQAKALTTLEMSCDGRVAGLFLDKALVDSVESTEGFIDMIRVIEGVKVAVLVKCVEENVCRVSMRSVGIDVSKVAMQFDGGGHIRAAGCTIEKSLEEAKAMLMPAIAEAVRSAS